MDKFKKNICTIIVFILFFLVTNFSYADEQKADLESSNSEGSSHTKEFSIFTGWGSGELKRQDDYNLIPLYFQFGFDIEKPFGGKLKFIFEPFLNTIVSPDSNIEIGNDFVLRYSYPILQKISLYIDFGLGMMFTSQHTYEQSTQFNFTDQGGGGISYALSKNKAINLGYRFRHFSNASIKEPNRGVEMDFILFGVTVSY